MFPSTAALSADAETTGAPPGSDLDRFLKLQDLKVEDLEANRAGHVSKHQVEIVAKHRGWTTTWLFAGFGIWIVIGLVMGVNRYMQNKSLVMFIVPAIGLAAGVIAFAVYAIFFRFPSNFADHKVVLVHARADKVSYLPTRGEYDLTANGVTYKGFGKISDDFSGLTLNLYVIPEDKLVVAIEPS